MKNIRQSIFGVGDWRFWDFIKKHPLLKRLFAFHWRHTLVIPGLMRGYAEPQDLILYGSFAALEQFMNDPWTHQTDWYENRHHKKTWQTACKLHYWWTKVRPSRQDPMDSFDSDMDLIHHMEPNLDENGKPYSYTMVWHENTHEYKEWRKICAAFDIFDKECYREDQSMLKRLIHIRRELWS